MKRIVWIAFLAFLIVSRTWAQEPLTSFSFTWETGEASLDMHIEDYNWQLAGKTLGYTESFSGRDSGMNGTGHKRKFPIKVSLSQGQMDRLQVLLKVLKNEKSVSLMPKNFQGTLLGYSLSFGVPQKEVTFDAPQYTVDQITREPLPGGKKSSIPQSAKILLSRFDALRDYLLTLNH